MRSIFYLLFIIILPIKSFSQLSAEEKANYTSRMNERTILVGRMISELAKNKNDEETVSFIVEGIKAQFFQGRGGIAHQFKGSPIPIFYGIENYAKKLSEEPFNGINISWGTFHGEARINDNPITQYEDSKDFPKNLVTYNDCFTKIEERYSATGPNYLDEFDKEISFKLYEKESKGNWKLEIQSISSSKGKIPQKPCIDPDGDDDEDGILNKYDKCCLEKGPEECDGCPFVPCCDPKGDDDNDGVINKYDKCCETKGDPENDGCPREMPPGPDSLCSDPEGDDDLDGIKNKDDNCCLTYGIESCNGCPPKDCKDEPPPDKPPPPKKHAVVEFGGYYLPHFSGLFQNNTFSYNELDLSTFGVFLGVRESYTGLGINLAVVPANDHYNISKPGNLFQAEKNRGIARIFASRIKIPVFIDWNSNRYLFKQRGRLGFYLGAGIQPSFLQDIDLEDFRGEAISIIDSRFMTNGSVEMHKRWGFDFLGKTGLNYAITKYNTIDLRVVIEYSIIDIDNKEFILTDQQRFFLPNRGVTRNYSIGLELGMTFRVW